VNGAMKLLVPYWAGNFLTERLLASQGLYSLDLIIIFGCLTSYHRRGMDIKLRSVTTSM
jgi:hypothetical protein